jgi:hypothetical protein
MDPAGRYRIVITLKAPDLLGLRHKKRRPRTFLDGCLGRGRLNLIFIYLIFMAFTVFSQLWGTGQDTARFLLEHFFTQTR